MCAILFLPIKDIFDFIITFQKSKDTSSPAFNEGVLEFSLIRPFLPQEGGLENSVI